MRFRKIRVIRKFSQILCWVPTGRNDDSLALSLHQQGAEKAQVLENGREKNHRTRNYFRPNKPEVICSRWGTSARRIPASHTGDSIGTWSDLIALRFCGSDSPVSDALSTWLSGVARAVHRGQLKLGGIRYMWRIFLANGTLHI